MTYIGDSGELIATLHRLRTGHKSAHVVTMEMGDQRVVEAGLRDVRQEAQDVARDPFAGSAARVGSRLRILWALHECHTRISQQRRAVWKNIQYCISFSRADAVNI